MKREFTATAFLILEGKFLLLFHPKHAKWLPPGGHLEENETPPEAARREVLEETGLQIEFLKQENVWIDTAANCTSFERPYFCLLENIPAKGAHPEHQHIDFIYVGIPLNPLEVRPEGTTEIRWLYLEEIEELYQKGLVFPDTLAASRQIHQDFFLASCR